MLIRVQRTFRLLLLIAALCVASLTCSGTDTDITVQPLVGVPEDAVYCQAVLEAIAGAQGSIDALISSVSLDDNPILPALAAAADRGVIVRALLDESDWAPAITAKNQPTLSYFLQQGIEARFDDPAVTLHAKLVIVDGSTVILGSSNWNRYALTEHRQADVLIHSCMIAAFYVDYFNVLWADDVLDQGVAITLPDTFGVQPLVLPLADLPDSASYARVLLALLEGAKQSIHVSMYRMSTYSGYGDSLANELVNGLTDAAHRGLDVKVLLDDCAYYADSAEANLMSALVLQQRGVEVRFDDPELTTHTKLVIVDGQTVVLGSTNWNYYSLQRNCEIDVAFVHFPEIALPFESFFQTLWAEGREIAL
jgi:phosphatidylserine/phosphatidylglycerophosphate/cardiolipin synthase-like enzyme